MCKMSAKERVQTRMVSASAVKTVLDFRHQLSVCLATQTEYVQPKPPISYYTTIILNYRNVAKYLGREPQIITFENSFHIWINIGYICERTLSAMSRVTSMRVLQTATYNRNFIVLLLSSRISQNWFPTASGVLLMVSIIIYLFQ